MPDRRLLRHGPDGLRVWYHEQPDGTFLIEYEQDLTAIIDYVAKLRNHEDRGWSKDRDGSAARRAFHMPDVVAAIWRREYGVDYYSADPDQQKRVRKLMNDPDWAKLRTAPGRL